MTKVFEFFFDFASPYTFIAHKKIIQFEKEKTINVKYKPVLLGGLLKLAGIKANADIPIKARYMIRDCKISAEKNNIVFKFNNYFPILTLNLMRCVIVAESKGFERNFINKVFEAIWIDGLNLNDSSILEKLLKNLEINPKVFLTDASDQKIKDDLKKRTEEAFSKGVFGTPSFVVNNKLFWGQDRLEFAISEANK